MCKRCSIDRTVVPDWQHRTRPVTKPASSIDQEDLEQTLSPTTVSTRRHIASRTSSSELYACAPSALSMWRVASPAASSGVLPRSRATT